MSAKTPNVFHIAFFTDGHHPKEAGQVPAGWMTAVKVTIEMDAIPPEFGPLAERFNVALAGHPLYKHLRTYALANKP
jgi:hypothetical protein